MIRFSVVLKVSLLAGILCFYFNINRLQNFKDHTSEVLLVQ